MIDVLESMEKCGGPGGTMGPCPGGGSGGDARTQTRQRVTVAAAPGKTLPTQQVVETFAKIKKGTEVKIQKLHIAGRTRGMLEDIEGTVAANRRVKGEERLYIQSPADKLVGNYQIVHAIEFLRSIEYEM